MPNKLSRYADGVMEAAWLVAVILLPVYFNLYSSRIFEPDKISLLRSLALIILAAWIVKAIADGAFFAPVDTGSNEWSWKDPVRMPLIWPALGLLVVTLLSSLFSLNPRISFWGSFQRMQGAYTTVAYLILFAAMLANLRSSEKLKRLITALIAGSLPVALYGVLQRYQLDPIPWGGDVSVRVASNLGNSIFVAAYLIMVMPLVAGRMLLAFRSILKDDSPHIPAMIRATLYVFILIIQIYALYLSGSRGPALGWLAGSFLMVMVLAIYTRQRWLIGSLTGFTILAIVFLALFNTQGGIFETLRNHPAIGRFGKLLDQESNTALVRKYIWEGAARLVAPHDPLTFPDGTQDRWNSLRLGLGYGPESMIIAYTPFYPPNMAHVERRNAIPDRAHNEVWDTLVNGGLIGLTVYLATILMVFYYGFKWLGLIPDKRWQFRFWLLTSFFGFAVSLILLFWQGAAYIGVGLPMGLLLGLVAYVMLFALFGQVDAPGSPKHFLRIILILSLLSAILAHFVETNFGIAIGVTRAYFWVFTALLGLIGLDWVGLETVDTIPKNSSDPAEKTTTSVAAPHRKKAAPTGVQTDLKTSFSWLEPILFGGLIVALLLSTLGYIFLSNPGGADVGLFDLFRSLTQLQERGPGASWALVGMLLITLLITPVLVGVESGSPGARSDWWKIALGSLSVAAPFAILFWIWHGNHLVAISRVRASTLTELMAQIDRFTALPANFQALTFGLILLLPCGLILVGRDTHKYSLPKILFSGGLLILVIWLGVVTNLRSIQADVVFKLAGQFNQLESWPVAVQVYEKAIDLAPNEDYYYLFLGQAYLEYANTLDAGPEKDDQFAQARDSLLAAQTLNPLNPDHTANLARLYNLWAFQASEPNDRLDRANRADEYFAIALRLSPNHARLWNEWSLLYRDLFQDEQRSQELLEHSLLLDSQYDWTYALLGDLYLRQADWLESGLDDPTKTLLEKAAAAYESALEYVGEESVQTRGKYKFALAEVYRRLGRYAEAIKLLSDPVLQGAVDAWFIAEKMGRIYQSLGDLENARVYARQALSLAPQDQRADLEAWSDELEALP